MIVFGNLKGFQLISEVLELRLKTSAWIFSKIFGYILFLVNIKFSTQKFLNLSCPILVRVPYLSYSIVRKKRTTIVVVRFRLKRSNFVSKYVFCYKIYFQHLSSLIKSLISLIFIPVFNSAVCWYVWTEISQQKSVFSRPKLSDKYRTTTVIVRIIFGRTVGQLRSRFNSWWLNIRPYLAPHFG